MATREEKIAFLKERMGDSSKTSNGFSSREEKIAFLKQKLSERDGYSSKINEPKEKTSQAQAALEGFGQGATFGYLPQLQAISEPGMTSALELASKNKILADLMGVPEDSEVDTGDYVERRDENLKRQQQLNLEHPKTYIGSALLGGVTSGIATAPLASGAVSGAANLAKAGKVVNEATRLGRIARAVGTGALYGAAMNPGDTEGKVDAAQLVDRIVNAGKGAAFGAAVQGAAEKIPAIQSGLKKTAKHVNERLGKRKGANEVIKITKELGIEATPGMTSKSQIVRDLESSLEQSPSIAGSLVRKKTNAVRKAIQQIADDATEDASKLTNYEAGESIKSRLLNTFQKRLKPLSDSYEEIKTHTKHIELPKKSINTVSKNIKNLDDVKLMPGSSGAQKAEQITSWIERVKSVDDIKKIRSAVQAESRSAIGSEKFILNIITKRLKKLEQNWITRGAISAARNAKEGDTIAKGLVSQLKEANRGYRGLAKDLDELSQMAKLSRGGKTVGENIRRIEEAKAEDLVKKLFDITDVKKLNWIKENHPDIFELLRQQKLAQITSKATNKNGNVGVKSLIRQVNGMQDDVQAITLGPEKLAKLKKVEKLLQAEPDMVGPSGTPKGLQVDQSMSPVFQAKELLRLAGYKALSSKGVQQTAEKLSDLRVANVNPENIVAPTASAKSVLREAFVDVPQRAARNEPKEKQNRPAKDTKKEYVAKSNLKGREKWANDGFQKIISHLKTGEAKKELSSMKSELLKNEKTKKLLIAASDIKPNSRVMGDILRRLLLSAGRGG